MAAEAPRRLVLVDDDPLTVSWLRALFEKEGYQVQTVATGRAAGEQVPLTTNARVPYLVRYEGTATGMALESIARLALDRLAA